jgi:hypothetical protein
MRSDAGATIFRFHAGNRTLHFIPTEANVSRRSPGPELYAFAGGSNTVLGHMLAWEFISFTDFKPLEQFDFQQFPRKLAESGQQAPLKLSKDD